MERPSSILIISGDDTRRGGFFEWEGNAATQKRQRGLNAEIVRIVLDAKTLKNEPDPSLLLKNELFSKKRTYDMIIAADIFGAFTMEQSLLMLEQMMGKALKQVLIIAPELSEGESGVLNNGIQEYHPVLFNNYDFSYLLLGMEHQNRVLLYSFFPRKHQLTEPFKTQPNDMSRQKLERPLRLVYILTDRNSSDATKQLLLQARHMHSRGHSVFLYTKSTSSPTAIPAWSDITQDDISGQFVLTPDDSYLAHIEENVEGADAIILVNMTQVSELRQAKIPIILWEHGNDQIFGDFGEPVSSRSGILHELQSFYLPPVNVMVVSPLLKKIMVSRFGVTSEIVCPAVKENVSPSTDKQNKTVQILLVGDGRCKSRNFAFVLDALVLAEQLGAKFAVSWITPTAPLKYMEPKGLRIKYYINPNQNEIDEIYKSADILLSHSLHEAFPMPPLEAMAAGAAVLALNSGGIETYGISGENCLLFEQGDLPGYAKAIVSLCSDDDLRLRLASAGASTAKKYSVDAMCDGMETEIRKVIMSGFL